MPQSGPSHETTSSKPLSMIINVIICVLYVIMIISISTLILIIYQHIINTQHIINMKLVQSFLGFKEKKSTILQQRNSLVKLLLFINIPSAIILYLFNAYVPQPYMDEYFHYHQFEKYYHNDFAAWDPKITTPPGLYLIQRLFSPLIGGSLPAMRALNCFLFGNIVVVFLLKIYDFQDPCLNNLSRTFNIAISPTIFFFNFMDYTDAASIAFLIAMYYYNLIKSEYRLGLLTMLAIMVRQNNIIWVGYLMIHRVLQDNKKLITAPKSFIAHIFNVLKILFNNKKVILYQNRIQLLVIALFFAYLRAFNQGRFVFGDHTNHQMKFHPTQLLYLALFCLLNVPISFGEYLSVVNSCLQRIYLSRHALAAYLLLLSISIICVDQWTRVHPFILADNRHYLFYIYRYFIKMSVIKYGLTLVYAFAVMFLFNLIVSSDLKLLKFMLWLGASFVYLSLGQLVEFRYFAAPFILISLEIENKNFNIDVEGVHKGESRLNNQQKMIWSNIIKVLINIVIISMFLFRPFSNQYGQGRIMW